jgi:DEAD/DEAH box helicase domain-containing protein
MADYLLHYDGILVSFNGVRFDIPCLLSGCDIDTFLALQKKKHLDLLADFYDCVQGRFRVSLNNLAENTLKQTKTGKAEDAPMLYKAGKWDELIKYCTADVRLTKALFEFGVAKGYVLYYDTQKGELDELSARYSDWLE